VKRFVAALSFLTILPLPPEELSEADRSSSVRYFPLVGLLLGLLACGVAQGLAQFLRYCLINSTRGEQPGTSQADKAETTGTRREKRAAQRVAKRGKPSDG